MQCKDKRVDPHSSGRRRRRRDPGWMAQGWGWSSWEERLAPAPHKQGRPDRSASLKITHSDNQRPSNDTSGAPRPHGALTARHCVPPDVPDVAAVPTLLHHFSEEGAGDVRVAFIAVHVGLTELDILRGPGLQTVQSVREEESARLQRGHVDTGS